MRISSEHGVHGNCHLSSGVSTQSTALSLASREANNWTLFKFHWRAVDSVFLQIVPAWLLASACSMLRQQELGRSRRRAMSEEPERLWVRERKSQRVALLAAAVAWPPSAGRRIYGTWSLFSLAPIVHISSLAIDSIGSPKVVIY